MAGDQKTVGLLGSKVQWPRQGFLVTNVLPGFAPVCPSPPPHGPFFTPTHTIKILFCNEKWNVITFCWGWKGGKGVKFISVRERWGHQPSIIRRLRSVKEAWGALIAIVMDHITNTTHNHHYKSKLKAFISRHQTLCPWGLWFSVICLLSQYILLHMWQVDILASEFYSPDIYTTLAKVKPGFSLNSMRKIFTG